MIGLTRCTYSKPNSARKSSQVLDALSLSWLCIDNDKTEMSLYIVSQKSKQNYFCYNYVKLPPNLTIFWLKDGKQSRIIQDALIFHLAVLNADVPNCQITL